MTNLTKSKKTRQQQIRLKWTLGSLSNDKMVKNEFSYSLRFCLGFNRFIQSVSFTVRGRYISLTPSPWTTPYGLPNGLP